MAGGTLEHVGYQLAVKKQLSVLQALLLGASLVVVSRLAAQPHEGVACDTRACAKLIDQDLRVLCRFQEGSGRPSLGGAGSAGLLDAAAGAAGTALRRSSAASPASSAAASAASAAGAELPAFCQAAEEARRAREEEASYLPDLDLRPMTALGGLRVVPGSNDWGVPMANSTLQINGKTLTFDDILFGYDLIFENMALFSYTSWFGVATQQDPSDAFQLASLIWNEQPDLLVEIGTNTGGGAIFYATVMREYNPDSLVLTIDPKDPAQDWANSVGKGCPTCRDVRCTRIWNSKNVRFIHGRASDPNVLTEVKQLAPSFKKVMIMHDGSHAYADVLEDLVNYDALTTVGSYMVVQDTKMTRMYQPVNGNPYPLGAARQFMRTQGNGRYVVDKQYEYLLYSQHHSGWLRKMRP